MNGFIINTRHSLELPTYRPPTCHILRESSFKLQAWPSCRRRRRGCSPVKSRSGWRGLYLTVSDTPEIAISRQKFRTIPAFFQAGSGFEPAYAGLCWLSLSHAGRFWHVRNEPNWPVLCPGGRSTAFLSGSYWRFLTISAILGTLFAIVYQQCIYNQYRIREGAALSQRSCIPPTRLQGSLLAYACP